MPAVNEIKKAYAKTAELGVTLNTIAPNSTGMESVNALTPAFSSADENRSATTPAKRPINAFSVSSCLTMRILVAPRDNRVRNSVSRDRARANCRAANVSGSHGQYHRGAKHDQQN